MQLFHASPSKFTQFSFGHFGTGEGGISLGRGIYLSPERRVAERIGQYVQTQRQQPFLYTATMNAAPHEVLDISLNWHKTVSHPQWGTINYPGMLSELGPEGARLELVRMGIKAVRDYEEDDRGYIVLCVQPHILRIDSCEELETA